MNPSRTVQANEPLVSVGMPVYNAASTLRESIEAVLAQVDVDLELVVVDNASTDGSWDIVSDIATRDKRVMCHRNPVNVGANGNYSRCFEFARGRYFKWASSNDWMAPTFLKECVSHLERHPEVVLAAPRAWLFNATLSDRLAYDGDVAFDDMDPVQRLQHVSVALKLNNVLNGVIRSDTLRRTSLIEHYVGADVVLVGELALHGKLSLLDERLFFRRMNERTATAMMDDASLKRHHYPRPSLRSLFPSWRRCFGALQAIQRAPLKREQRLRAVAWTLRQALWQGGALGRDVVDAARKLHTR